MPLNRDRSAALEQANEPLDVVGGEGTTDGALGECGVAEDKLDAVAAVELGDDFGERRLGKRQFAFLLRKSVPHRRRRDFFHGGSGWGRVSE